MFKKILLVIVGGGLGSACRYLLTLASSRAWGEHYAWGTLAVNLIGCLLIGFLFTLVEQQIITPEIRLLLITGFLGGFTTFSSFALESVTFFQNNNLSQSLLHIILNNFGGCALVLIGLWLGRFLFAK